MRGAASSMTVLRPKTAREALDAYASTPHAMPLVGGTDLMVAWNLGILNDRVILDLSPLRAWARIETRDGGRTLRIGALATHTALQRHPIVRKQFPLLAEACATVGGVQIQNRGTIGGNIANASPAGDTLPPLATYDARIHIVSAAGERTVPFLDIFAGVKQTTLRPGELIDAIDLPFPTRPPERAQFRKVGTRAAQAISKTVFSGLLWRSPLDGKVEEVRLALGSMAPTIRRLYHTEQFLIGQPLTAEIIAEAASLVSRDVSPIDDVRSTAAYRLQTSQRIVSAFLSAEL